jgi:hypothetical protein
MLGEPFSAGCGTRRVSACTKMPSTEVLSTLHPPRPEFRWRLLGARLGSVACRDGTSKLRSAGNAKFSGEIDAAGGRPERSRCGSPFVSRLRAAHARRSLWRLGRSRARAGAKPDSIRTIRCGGSVCCTRQRRFISLPITRPRLKRRKQRFGHIPIIQGRTVGLLLPLAKPGEPRKRRKRWREP